MATDQPPRRRWLLGAAIVGALLTFAVPVAADPLPLFPEPTASLSCDDGSSVLTMHWPVGEYGNWSVGDLYLGDVSGPGGIFTVPTDESFPVPAGWQATHSTVRLNRDTVGDTSYNEHHVTVDGAACPFSTPVTATIDCGTRTLSTSIPAGHVTQITVYDQDGNVIYFQRYPRYNRFGHLLQPVQIGPVVLDAPVPDTVTSVRVEVTVDNTVLTTSQDTSCVPVPPPSVVVRGTDGALDEVIQCDGTVTTDPTAAAIAVERSGATDQAITVGLAYSGDLAATSSLPATVVFEAGQDRVVVPVESSRGGALDVSVVAGAGYAVGAVGSATVRVSVRSTAEVCDDVPPGDPGGGDGSGSGGGDGSGGGSTGTDAAAPPAVPTTSVATPSLPVVPGAAPPADVISGVAHLTG